jgi:hypothetical protein
MMTRILVLLVVASQLADVATFGLAVRAQGIGGELGPLAGLYTSGGFGAVALAKCAAIGVALGLLAWLGRRLRMAEGAVVPGGHGRRLVGGRHVRPVRSDDVAVHRDLDGLLETGVGAPELGTRDAVHLARALLAPFDPNRAVPMLAPVAGTLFCFFRCGVGPAVPAAILHCRELAPPDPEASVTSRPDQRHAGVILGRPSVHHVHLLPSLYHTVQVPHPIVRRLALLVATVGVFGATTGLLAIT